MTYTHMTYILESGWSDGFADMVFPDYESAEKRARELIDALVIKHNLKLNGVEPVRRLTPTVAYWEWTLGTFTVGISTLKNPIVE